MSEWISVEDQLPEDGEMCVVLSDRYAKGFAIESYFVDIPLWPKLGITHWIPLPQPPETNQ